MPTTSNYLPDIIWSITIDRYTLKKYTLYKSNFGAYPLPKYVKERRLWVYLRAICIHTYLEKILHPFRPPRKRVWVLSLMTLGAVIEILEFLIPHVLLVLLLVCPRTELFNSFEKLTVAALFMSG